ncbi:hypothetical protein HF324_30680 [Chitinophaga oryzae]|uniref:PEGA domain-containing protein n=1 Tax=Chitinophaga oryzae TaxID=2725414 RepID=A0ABX6LPL4_9BACT|nr:hypothetical protein [Chitinophaga oryzae]QJB41978.1 hypothetical protein HF324_30680 [Chitinophaga oryzae]
MAQIAGKRIIGLLLVLVLIGCYAGYELLLKPTLNGATLIDNPTGRDITVAIDQEQYVVPARSFLRITLAEGVHNISCEALGMPPQELHMELTSYGVINPSRSKYVIYNTIYTRKNLSSRFKPYAVEGREVYSLLGEPEVTNALFIPDRTLGKGNLDVAAPSLKSYQQVDQDYAYLTRIFRLGDFFEYCNQHNL